MKAYPGVEGNSVFTRDISAGSRYLLYSQFVYSLCLLFLVERRDSSVRRNPLIFAYINMSQNNFIVPYFCVYQYVPLI